MGLLSRDQILKAKLPSAEVEIPALGGSVRLQGLSLERFVAINDITMQVGRDLDAYEVDQSLPEDEQQGIAKPRDYDPTLLRFIHCAVDERGELLFSMDDYDTLNQQMGAGLLGMIYSDLIALDAGYMSAQADRVDAKKKPSARTQRGD